MVRTAPRPTRTPLRKSPATPRQSTAIPGPNGSARTKNRTGAEAQRAGSKAARQAKKRKRGRPPKDSSTGPQLKRLPYRVLKKTGQSFPQDRYCCEDVTSRLPKCRECRAVPAQRHKTQSGINCRFTAFRLVRFTRNGRLNVSGFCEPSRDACGESERLWRAALDGRPAGMQPEEAKFLLAHVGNQFCDLVRDEEAARLGHRGDDDTVAWKRVVQGFREMCDVCDTTLFNVHWVCSRCGFAVCVDCYRSRSEGTAKVWGEPGADRDKSGWLLCGVRQHEQSKLMLTQIVTSDALATLNRQVHEARLLAGLPLSCQCDEARRLQQAGVADGDAPGAPASADSAPKLEPGALKLEGGGKVKLEEGAGAKLEGDGMVKLEGNGRVKLEEDGLDCARGQDNQAGSPLAFLADVALSGSKINSDEYNSDNSDSDSEEEAGGGGSSALRRLLVPDAQPEEPKLKAAKKQEKPRRSGWSMEDTLDEVLDKVSARYAAARPAGPSAGAPELRHFVRRCASKRGLRERLPIRIMTLSESTRLYPAVRHSWLCDGKLLRLHDTTAPDGVRLFRDQWKRGQPVLCSGIGGGLDRSIWSVDAFIRDFGDVRNDLINCKTGNIVPNQPMRRFWEGFECVSRRLRDDKGQPMILKLKDWPPGDDFADMMPDRFSDLMSVLPMTDYTRRDGRLNLASCLPDCFVRPDLGPKMYIAYGCALHPSKASTNLHLDVSDAVNIMVHVGIPPDGDADNAEALRAIDEAGCDQLTKRRVKDELPGALWHIYHAADADKIRDLLNKIAIERGDQLEPHHDPIHDQSWYLDGPLRCRLYEEYGVEGYPIVQCAGDAVFIPAGAPHQVRNLHSCIKVAEDFVSPENIGHCFDLTQEFRSLSETHSNHEDKLQIKNIIYHAMKDAVSCLLGRPAAAEAE
ncbi:LOW QUALITY PROTEIN: lysine-specific demethylase 3A-like [Pollicipes pollicipes]|uniref:LOW QUALITY PROTEIN: lysine-specific demethylase 3A-like n=1 Tax=Pollicipes pollicipes TaxID=41117 RepID=UPI00188549F1|nr:LOW QUALITY PROTEIN: lysine-specific demethylase 3A-like [Pollicipes pollicipes]